MFDIPVLPHTVLSTLNISFNNCSPNLKTKVIIFSKSISVKISKSIFLLSENNKKKLET